jgi:hypothetical protein
VADHETGSGRSKEIELGNGAVAASQGIECGRSAARACIKEVVDGLGEEGVTGGVQSLLKSA